MLAGTHAMSNARRKKEDQVPPQLIGILAMMNFLASRMTDPKNRTGEFEVESDGRTYTCRVALDRVHGATQAEVTWT